MPDIASPDENSLIIAILQIANPGDPGSASDEREVLTRISPRAPTIYRLSIERFRCIKTFTWHPAKGVNVIYGAEFDVTSGVFATEAWSETWNEKRRPHEAR